MYLYVLASNALAGYYIYFKNIYENIFKITNDELNENYQSIVFMNFISNKENINPYNYEITSIDYKYIESIKDNKILDKSFNVEVNRDNFYNQLHELFVDHLMERQEIYNNPIYIFVKSENDKLFLEEHLSYLQLYEDYIHINSLENITRYMVELKSYKIKDIIYHFGLQTRNLEEVEIMNKLYDKLMSLVSERVYVNNIDSEYYSKIKLISNSDEYCNKRNMIYKLNECDILETDNIEEDNHSDDSTDYCTNECINEYIMKQLKANPLYIHEYLNYHYQLEIVLE